MDLYVLGGPEHDFTIFRKCLCAVCNTNFVGALAQKLLDRILWNFIFSWT